MKTKLLTLICAVLIPLTGCQKQAIIAEPVDFTAEHAMDLTAVPDHYRKLYDGHFIDQEVEAFRAKLPYDSISLTRSPCFGTCPVYSVTFHRDGKAELVATRHLPTLGKFTGEINPLTYGRLCYFIEHSRFEEMKASYRANWTDDTTCTITITQGAARTEVEDYGSVSPIELWAIQEALDSIRQKIEWKAVP